MDNSRKIEEERRFGRSVCDAKLAEPGNLLSEWRMRLPEAGSCLPRKGLRVMGSHGQADELAGSSPLL